MVTLPCPSTLVTRTAERLAGPPYLNALPGPSQTGPTAPVSGERSSLCLVVKPACHQPYDHDDEPLRKKDARKLPIHQEDSLDCSERQDQGSQVLNEDLINRLGYHLMSRKKIDPALGVFRFNVHAFPGSGNAYDSLAEAYGEKGDFPAAIENYRKAHALDPDNRNALAMIRKFTEKLAKKN